MPDIIALLWVVFAILVVGAILFVLYNPPRTLLKFRHKDSELEIAAPSPSAQDQPRERELDKRAGQPPERDEEGAPPPEQEDTVLAKAYRLLRKGSYAEGMTYVRQETADKSEKERAEFTALARHIAASAGSDEALQDMRESLAVHSDYSDVAFWLGIALRNRGDVDGAIAAFNKAQEIAATDEELTSAALALSATYAEHDRESDTIELLTDTLPRITTRKNLSQIYARLAAVYKDATPPRPAIAFAMYELSLEADPTNDSLRFETAYALSNAGADAQALYHYRKLLARRPDYENAANNAGVSAGDLGLPVAQVGYYRKAAALGETLPMANLAWKFINEGFVTEARELVDSALATPDHHRNVLQAMGRIAEVETEEDTKLERIQTSAAAVAKWRIRFGKAALVQLENRRALSGRYTDGNTTVEVEVESEEQFRGGMVVGTDRREFSGTLLGATGEFAWTTTAPQGATGISALLGKKSGTGAWIFEGDSLVGYIVDEAKEVDPARISGWALREFRRIPSSGE